MALVGSVLISVGSFWIVLSSGTEVVNGGISTVLRLLGPVGVAIATTSLFGLYALLVAVRSLPGLLWGTMGAVVLLVSLPGLVWMVFHQPSTTSPVSTGGTPLLAVAALTVGWLRPIGIMVFGVAAMMADLRGPWEYVLFAIGMLETPLPALLTSNLAGETSTAGWPVLFFGLPGVQSGIVAAVGWLLFGYALLSSERELRRRISRRDWRKRASDGRGW